jgi:acyl-CoA reductase-like NAD-dependent aldehyde dehydrogenase
MPSLFIDGAWSASTSGATSPVVNPFDASVADEADVERAIAAARRAFDDRAWRDTTPGERAAMLGRTADILRRD